MKKTNLLILFVWMHFVGMERLNHINGDILDGLLQVGRIQIMRNSTVPKINGLVFVMGCNEPSPMHLGKTQVLQRKLISICFWDFCFQGEIYHFLIKIICNYQLQNLHCYNPNESTQNPRRLTNSSDPRGNCHYGRLSLNIENHTISSNSISGVE